MYFGRNNINTNNMMSMSNCTMIDFVEQSTHLGTIIYSDITRKNVDFAVNDLFMRTNNLMADFSYTHTSTLSVLYNYYSMNVYGFGVLMIINQLIDFMLPEKNNKTNSAY